MAPARSASTTSIQLSGYEARPFVKWAGGKGSVVGAIAAELPDLSHIERYVEPFVGAGAFFFWIRRNRPELLCRIADNNEELMNAYSSIRDRVDRVVAKLQVHAMMHDKEYYYAVRKKRPLVAAERAARCIYLNRTCYNGLYRVNRHGQFNVPMGRYRNPRIVDEENLAAVSETLQGVSVLAIDFEKALADSGKGDLVYLDPPYHPISSTSNFTSYTVGGFGEDEQRRLAEVYESLCRRGAAVIQSNSATPFIRSLYQRLDPAPRMKVIDVPRSINSKAISRGVIKELLISYTPSADRPSREASAGPP